MLRKTILISILLSFTAFAIAQDIDNIFKDRSEVYFTFDVNTDTDLQSLSRAISIDNVTPEMQVFAYANKKGFSEFMKRGISYTILQHPGTLHHPRMLDVAGVKNIDSWDFYPTYDAYVDMMYQFEADFPELCDVFSIGTTNEGRELLVARITDNVSQSE
ncbi:MAG: zinc carboxypeptidase, partial [Bacteroidetes bacterium]